MSQNSSNDKAAMLATLDRIQKVEGFDPTPFAVEYTDLNTQETRKRLPVMIQMAWFRLKYPEGRIAVEVTPGKDCFVATARVYPSYKDPVDCFWRRLQRRVGRMHPSHPYPRENGHRQQRSGLLSEMQALGFSFLLPGMTSQIRRQTNYPMVPALSSKRPR